MLQKKMKGPLRMALRSISLCVERFRKAKRQSEQHQDEQPADDTQDTTKS